MMSGPEPVALPMIRRMGFSGYLVSAACAGAAISAGTTRAAKQLQDAHEKFLLGFIYFLLPKTNDGEIRRARQPLAAGLASCVVV